MALIKSLWEKSERRLAVENKNGIVKLNDVRNACGPFSYKLGIKNYLKKISYSSIFSAKKKQTIVYNPSPPPKQLPDILIIQNARPLLNFHTCHAIPYSV